MKEQGGYRHLLKEMGTEWRWVLKYADRYKLIILLYIVLGIIATVMSLGTAVASKYLIDAVVSHLSGKIYRYVAATVSLALFQFVFSALTSWISAVVGTRANNEMREEIYTGIMSSKWEEIHSFHSGDLLNRIEGDVATVSSGVISFIPGVFTKLLQFFGSLIIVLYYDKVMALLSLISAPFLFFASRMLVKTMRRYNSMSRELNGKVLSYSEESIRNLQVIKAFDLTEQYIKNFRNTLDTYRNVKLKYEKFSVIMTLVLSVIGLLVSYLCYGWGIYRLWQGVISFGTMTLFLQIAGSLSDSFSAVASLVPSAIAIATSAGRIREIVMYDKDKDADRKKALHLLRESAEDGVSIHCEDVSFRYKDGDSNVLNDISFTVNPGETIALIGSSGEGKTTLLKLLLGLVEPDSGKLYISNNKNSLDITDSTRRFCSYIPQDLSVFSGTIAENLRMIKSDAEDEELIEVLKLAELWDYVSALPEGINTVIGEMGENISTGQAQRISIARAMLKNSPVLLMDEATSALDEDTESRVLKNIMKKDRKKVCILTTHRDSMLKYCDRVYRINSDGSMIIVD